MNCCDRQLNRFSEFVDGELSAVEREDFLRHLDSCPGCRDELQDFQAAHDALLTLASPVPQRRPVLSAVRARIRQEEERKRKMRWVWLPAPAIAAAVLGVIAWVNWPAVDTQEHLANSRGHSSVEAPQPAAPEASAPLADDVQGSAGTDVVAVVPEPDVTVEPSAGPAPAVSRPEAPAPAAPVRRSAPRPVLMAKADPAPFSARSVSGGNRTVSVDRSGRNRTLPAPAPAAAVDEKPRIMVVAYRPAASFSANMQESDTGRDLAEISVNSTYAADGSVKNARVILHFPPSAKAAEDNDTKDRSNDNPANSNTRPGPHPGTV